MSDKEGPKGRLFIAAEMPEGIVSAVAEYARKIEPAFPGRYVPRQNYHVTLAFLGDTLLSSILDLDQIVREAAAGMEPFECSLSQAGSFGKRHSAIVWAGLTNQDRLSLLARRIRKGLDARGFSYDPKPAKPHITIARGVDLTGRSLPPLPNATGEIRTTAVFLSTRRDGNLVYLPEVAISFGEDKVRK